MSDHMIWTIVEALCIFSLIVFAALIGEKILRILWIVVSFNWERAFPSHKKPASVTDLE